MIDHQTDVAVVGAGIVGLAHAYIAAKAGRRVSVFEKNPAACGASIRNFGMIWPIGQPAGDPYQLALRSREIWLHLLHDAGLPYWQTGSLHAVYRDDEVAVAREFVERGKHLGYDCAWLNKAETLEKSKALRPEGLMGALWSSTEMTVDPRLVILKMAAFLSERYGVQFYFNTPVKEVESQKLCAGNLCCRPEIIVIAAGDDFQTLFPESLKDAQLTRCKLQMLRTVSQPENWSLGPSLAFGLSFRHYPAFRICESLAVLKNRVAEETPEFDKWGIHVMASENSARQITLGDSHEYSLAVDIFDRTQISDLILNYSREYLCIPDLRIAETWHGVYAKHLEKQFLRLTPTKDVRMVTVTSGLGMTLSFGLAEQTFAELGFDKCSF